MKVKLGISNRHAHLTKDTYFKLFDHEMTIDRELEQAGEFVAGEMITIKTDKDEFNNVRIIGPYRKYDQVEISRRDALKLGLNPPVRKSGDIKNSEFITLKTNKGEVKIEGCIIAERHVHMNPLDAKINKFYDNEEVFIKVLGDKGGYMRAKIKINEDVTPEAHIDTDDAASFLLNQNDEVEIIK